MPDYTFTVRAEDALGRVATRAQTVTINAAVGDLPPTLASLVLWIDGFSSPAYQGMASTSALSRADGEAATRFDSLNSIARVIGQAGPDTIGSRRRMALSGFDGFKCGHFEGFGSSYAPYAKPAAGAAYSTGVTWATLATVSAVTVMMLLRINNLPADTGAAYANTPLFGDGGGYLGLFGYKSGANAVCQSYNWPSSETRAEQTIPLGEWRLITMQHGSNQIRCGVNGGAYTTAASGNTGSVAASPTIGNNGPDVDFDVGAVVVYRAAHSAAALLPVQRRLALRAGIVIP